MQDKEVQSVYLNLKEKLPTLSKEILLQMAQEKVAWQRDTNRITKEQIREKLRALDLSPFVLELFDGNKKLEDYGFYDGLRSPYHFVQMTRKQQDVYHVDSYFPLFEIGFDFSQVIAYDTHKSGFIRYDPEEAFEVEKQITLTWEGLFIRQILIWWEDEKSDRDILNICQLLGLSFSSEILNSAKSRFGAEENYSFEARKKWETEMLELIGGRVD